ncbi:pentatricopeptide repeat-containing protein At1g31920-like [Syzygium oleosum]|uniref:pentatricopeptide repeat-containing protein At1g31920-like n=1 Tax=Syzygium oleosum TaxID=219896 RepID=UPI0024B9D889|nr:pentatricopeptide repeat-containing protein At1g31920-like [Syzygium oleosum]
MGGNDVAPNHYKFPIVVKGFVVIGSSSDGEKVHGRVLKLGFESDLFVRNALIPIMLQEEEIEPNRATIVSALISCANTGDLNKGHLIYAYMKDNEIEADVLLSTALLTMYAKCGTMNLAKKVFDQMPDRSVVSGNAMIVGYGLHGHGEKALEMFLRDGEERSNAK